MDATVVAHALTTCGLDEGAFGDATDTAALAHFYRAWNQSMPFNSVHILQGSPLCLSGLHQSSMAMFRRGGVCHEQAQLMAELLRHLGFDARTGGGEVLMPSGEWTFPFSHRLVLVDMEGEGTYLLDPGFPFKPLGILKLEEGTQQRVGHAAEKMKTYVMTKTTDADLGHDVWTVNLKPAGAGAQLQPLHRTHMREYGAEELRVGAEWVYCEKTSPFRSGWLMAAVGADGDSVITLANGSWAGSEVDPGLIKHVVRPSPGQETVDFIPVTDTERVEQIMREQLRLTEIPAPGGVAQEKGPITPPLN